MAKFDVVIRYGDFGLSNEPLRYKCVFAPNYAAVENHISTKYPEYHIVSIRRIPFDELSVVVKTID